MLVESGAFRPDLYYRLCVFAISVPPLRERQGDILTLATHFLDKHLPKDRATAPTLSSAAQAALVALPWPGNVRELENLMIRAGHSCETNTIDIEHLGLVSTSAASTPRPGSSLCGDFGMLKKEIVRAFEQEYLTRLMREAGGNVTRAAQLAGKDRRDLGKLLKKHGLTRMSSRSAG